MAKNWLESNGDELRQFAEDFERTAQERQRYADSVTSLTDLLPHK